MSGFNPEGYERGYEQPTEPLSLPLFPPGPAARMAPGSPTAGDVPTKRTVWRIMLTAVIATVLAIALLLGGYVLYHNKVNEISRLKEQRQELRATNGALHTQLGTTQTKLGNPQPNRCKEEPDEAEEGPRRGKPASNRELQRRIQPGK